MDNIISIYRLTFIASALLFCATTISAENACPKTQTPNVTCYELAPAIGKDCKDYYEPNISSDEFGYECIPYSGSASYTCARGGKCKL